MRNNMKKEAAFSYKELANGDIGFSYRPKFDSFNITSNYYIIGFVLLGLSMFIMNQFESRWRGLIIIIPWAFFVYAYKKTNVLAINRKRERTGLLEVFDKEKITAICKNVFGEEVSCMYHKYIIRQTEELGKFERLVAAYLSNGKFVVFKVVNRKNEKGKWSLTIRTTPLETNDEQIKFKLVPLHIWLRRYLDPDKNMFMVLLLYLLLWSLLVVVVIVPVCLYPKEWTIVVWCYVILGYTLFKIVKPEKYPRWLFNAIMLPGRTITLFITLTGPILVFLVGAFIIVVIGTLIAAVLFGVSWLVTEGNIGINVNYIAFLIVVCLSLSSVYANKLIHSVYERMDIMCDTEEKTLESPILGFVEYIYQKENINCLIYMAYLVFLAVSTTKHYLMEPSSYLVSEGIDMAVTKAFLIHIAFTNMVARRKEIKFKTAGMMEYVIRMLGGK